MNVIIRADANTRMGTGHLMRCIALAQALQNQGERTIFLSYIEKDVLRKMICDKGFEVVSIDNPHPHPDDENQVRNLLAYKGKAQPTWLVLDGYHFDPAYQSALRATGCKVLVIDDVAHQPEYHADILLNQNIHAPNLNYNCSPDTVRLLGTRYALLRKEFLNWKGTKREIPETARHILVTLGGADPENVTLTVVRALKCLKRGDLKVKIVVGPANPNQENIEKQLNCSLSHFQVLSSATDMPSLMAWADMAVSAAGSTSWELSFMGVPFAVVILADNQEGNAEGLAKAGGAINCGWSHSLSTERLAERLAELIDSRSKRMKLSEIGRQLVDGKGVERVVQRILPVDLCLRNACWDDCELILQWANDPVARTASFHSDPIPWDEHKRWFSSKIQDPSCVFFIATTHVGERIAQVRFEMKDGVAVISASLGREFREYGWGSKIIRQACEKLFRERKVECVQALIKNDNVSSLRAFERAGFKKAQDIECQGFPATLMRYGRRNDT